MKKELSPRCRMLLSMLIFGTVGLFVRYIPLPSAAIACARGVIGAACIYLVILGLGRRLTILHME